jgi:hypothetical protein
MVGSLGRAGHGAIEFMDGEGKMLFMLQKSLFKRVQRHGKKEARCCPHGGCPVRTMLFISEKRLFNVLSVSSGLKMVKNSRDKIPVVE